MIGWGRMSTVWHSICTMTTWALGQAEGAAPTATEQQGPQGFGNMWIFFVAFIAIMYFFMIRPNQKREKERREMLASLSKGTRVVTNGGIHGAIVGLNEKSVVLRVSDEPAVKMEFARGSIARVLSGDEEL